jgi:hypothetical protein
MPIYPLPVNTSSFVALMQYPDQIVNQGLFPMLIMTAFFFIACMAGISQLGVKRGWLAASFLTCLVALPLTVAGILPIVGFAMALIMLMIGLVWNQVSTS